MCKLTLSLHYVSFESGVTLLNHRKRVVQFLDNVSIFDNYIDQTELEHMYTL